MLTPEQFDKLRPVIISSGWKEFIRPACEQKKAQMAGLAMSLPSERPEPYKSVDDSTFIHHARGYCEAMDWLLNAFENEVKVHLMNRQRDELDSANHVPAANQ